jgi:predicted transcriptional regulator of viral defense system
MQNTTHTNRIIELARQKGIIRSLDLNDAGIPRAYLTRMVKTGRLEKTGRGIYQLPDIPQSENAGMEIITAKIPQAVFCLLTALQFHQLTNQLPRQIWVAMPQGSHTPKVTYPPITMIQCNPKHLEDGVEICRCNNHDFRIYNVAKTIVDCFKHRNKVGLDVALEALKAGLRQKKVTVDELWYFAKIARVTKVMRPYIEALT